MNKSYLDKLWEKGTNFLGTQTAIMGGAMTWVSNYKLVAAISNAGGLGTIACGSISPQDLDQEITKTLQLTSNPFAVNLITMHPQIYDLIDVCGQHKIKHVVLAGGLPSSHFVSKLKTYECNVIGFAPAYIIARKLQRMGVDALIIEGHEAGGHIGPVSTSVLAQEILPKIKNIPIFVAGGIGRGEAIASYLLMGASGCQIGTRFVCAFESNAHPNFKKIFIQSQARDAVISTQVDSRLPVIPVRAVANNATQKFIEFQTEMVKKINNNEIALKDAQLKIEHYWAGALRRAVIDGDTNTGSVMAGQSIGMVEKEQSVQEIIDELVFQSSSFLENFSKNLA